MTDPRCKHDVDLSTARPSEFHMQEYGRVVIDVWCRKCGKSGSAMVYVDDFDFDVECNDE